MHRQPTSDYGDAKRSAVEGRRAGCKEIAQVSFGRQYTKRVQLVNGQHIAEASIDSPRWTVATVAS